jgi:hypothetical protein
MLQRAWSGMARNWRLNLSHLQLDLGACSNASGLFESPIVEPKAPFYTVQAWR